MRRSIFHISVAVITFLIGVMLQLQTIKLADRAMRRDNRFAVDSASPTVSSPELLESPLNEPCPVLVCMDRDRNLYLGKQMIAQPEYPNERLLAALTGARQKCEWESDEAQSKEIEDPIVSADWRPSIVYLKVFRPRPHDVPNLVEAAKASGADRIVVLRDRLKISSLPR
jgi:hypothetical protein